MPKAKKRKESEFDTAPVRSIFLYGHPNAAKLGTLRNAQKLFVQLVNDDIQLLLDQDDLVVDIIKNDKKSPAMRAFEKAHRPQGVNSAFCQNAFDEAVTKLSQYYDNIRSEMLGTDDSCLLQSKVLFGLTLAGASKDVMICAMQEILSNYKNGNGFYEKCLKYLKLLPEQQFLELCADIRTEFEIARACWAVPYVKRESVPMDSRLMKIEISNSTVYPYVIVLSDPLCRGKRIEVPVNTSKHSLHKIKANDMAGTVRISIQGKKLRVEWSYEKHFIKPAIAHTVGVDTGIRDAFHTSDGRAIGSMNLVLDFYQNKVEKSFAGLSDLRNKKKKICHYLKKHPDLPDHVRQNLLKKVDHLDHMLQTAEAPYRKKRQYYSMLNHEIKCDVRTYMTGLTHDTLTVVEQLDMKEFKKSRKLNGRLSTFARGKLQQKLLSELNWYGYDYQEIAPDYTSQVCPVCHNLDHHNRSETDSKVFVCTCCGYSDDADHVGSLNIRNRADDKEILALTEQYKYKHYEFQKQLKRLYDSRHIDWLSAHSKPILQEPEQPVAVQ